MGRGRDRGPRRRGFDDDAYDAPHMGRANAQQPSRRPAQATDPGAPSVDGIVKWFNREKGFGFVELADGSGDVFLHIAVLEAAGYETVEPATKLSVQIGWGQKGRQIGAVLSVDTSTAVAPQGKRKIPFGGRERVDAANAVDAEGTVKWFNPAKGFGFVACDDGAKDVFVHISVVERAGLRELDEGQRLSMKIVKTPKGREAISLAPLR
jgi:cold shock protein